jgi:peptidoglycan/xylan/chitin deacetylase (PgdA/CDA1 family)
MFMTISKQDLAVLLLYYLGYAKVRNFLLRFRGKPVARFVMFHDIPDEAEENFRATLRFLKQQTNVVSLNDYFAGRLCSKKVNVVVTFDDGYKSWISKAAPALRQLEMPATFFISSGFLGLSDEKEDEFTRVNLKVTRKITGSLSEKDVRWLSEEGFAIGGHTCAHANLADIRGRTELLREILNDKRKLEAIIGKEIHFFAYPFGVYNHPSEDLKGVLEEAGYTGAVTTIPGFNNAGTNRYFLHRELTRAVTPLCVFKALVFGTYDGVDFLKRRTKSIFALNYRFRSAPNRPIPDRC